MAVWNLLPQVPAVLTRDQLTALGFTNVPNGYWVLKSTAYGDSSPALDKATVIPLVGKGYQNKHTGSDASAHTHSMNLTLNGKTMYSATGRKTVDGAALGGLFTDVQSRHFFYPYYFNFDLSATMSGVTLEGDRSVNLEAAHRPCVAVYLWLESATGSNTLSANSMMDFPVGDWYISDVSGEIPLIGHITSTNTLNEVDMIGGWNYGTNNVQSGAHYSMSDRSAYGIFFPGAFSFDITDTMNANGTITGTSGYTVTHWLKNRG